MLAEGAAAAFPALALHSAVLADGAAAAVPAPALAFVVFAEGGAVAVPDCCEMVSGNQMESCFRRRNSVSRIRGRVNEKRITRAKQAWLTRGKKFSETPSHKQKDQNQNEKYF